MTAAAALVFSAPPPAVVILEQKCLKCHGDLRALARKTAMPGNPEQSRMMQMISGAKPRMPMQSAPLSSAEISEIRNWIAAGATFPEETWWSLRPLLKPAGSGIDDFISAKLREKGLHPTPEADRRTLIRRVTFDLHGLPPTWRETQDFLSDSSPTAYEKVVDRLLASPRYGERWGRHWLDVAHYGESHGYDKDKPRRNAWPYRDYVIRSLNEDKPYSRFVEEQLAGDVLFPEDPQATVATGFIAAGPWDFVGNVELREGTVDKKITRLLDRDDMVTATMSAFTSMTAHCARCHNHKFDPIPQDDYYSLQAVFAGIDRGDRPFDDDPSVFARRRPLLLERKAVLARIPPLKKGDPIPADLADVDRRIAELPKPRLVYAADPLFEPRVVEVLARGSVENPVKPATPGALSCVRGLQPRFEAASEGARRAALAKWITAHDNPLTWRSIVNRVWHYHFGAGLVDTPNDFGRMGSQPTHPELLDWLAATFRDEDGGSLKRLHKRIVVSRAYRQSSAYDAANAAIDGDNRFLWRMIRMRLDAESVRDTTLFVSGKLDSRMGGPSDEQFWFKDDHSPVYDYTKFDVDSPASYRRSVYRFIVRSVPDPFMDRLDCPDASLVTAKRNITITAIQALALLNNPFMVRQAAHLADCVRAASPIAEQRVRELFRRTLGRDPAPEEGREVGEYASRFGLENACRVMLNSNEFLFVD
jgi:hypothetical protein